MLQALRTFGRVLLHHLPAMMAWFLAGEALHQALVQLAGFVGGYTTLGGLLLLPLAVTAKLVAYVAMYLSARPALPHVAAPAAGYRDFAGAILASILPFFAFYSAWGLLNADFIDFANVASDIAFRETGYDLAQLGDRGGLVSVGVLPVVVLVVALAVRMLMSKFRERLPGWTLALAVYAEVLWTFMLFTLVGQWWVQAQGWLAGRVGATWLQGIGDWFAANLSLVAIVWEAALWVFGILVTALLMPAAWLAVAGVIYGTTFDAAPGPVQRGMAALRGTAATLSRSLLQRFESLWAAIAVIWRGGPVLFGAAVCAYAVWGLAERWGTRGVLELFGGHESEFWEAFYPLILVGTAMVFEPLRVALVATAYDTVIARPEAHLEAATAAAVTEVDAGPSRLGAGPSRLDAEADDVSVSGHVEFERAGGVVGEDEDGENIVGR